MTSFFHRKGRKVHAKVTKLLDEYFAIFFNTLGQTLCFCACLPQGGKKLCVLCVYFAPFAVKYPPSC